MTNNLIHRLEAAEGPSRELDAEIRFCTVGDMYRCNFEEGGVCGNCEEPPGCGKWLGLQDERRSYPRDWRDDERLPTYTASLDAAVSLVPEEWEWQVSTRAPKPRGGRAWIHNGEPQLSPLGTMNNPKYRGFESVAFTPALALCIAALKAREAGKEKPPAEAEGKAQGGVEG